MEKRAGVKSLVANISPAERELSSPISTSHTSVRRNRSVATSPAVSWCRSIRRTEKRAARIASRTSASSDPGRKPGRSGKTVDRPGALRRSGVNGEVIDIVHLLHVLEDQCLSPCQAQSAGLIQQRIARYTRQDIVVMLLADFPEPTIAGEYFVPA